LDITSFTVIVIPFDPEQLSVAVKLSAAGISAGQDTVISVGKSLVNTGFAVSSIVKTAVVVEVFSQSSAAVKVTSMLLEFPQAVTKLSLS
jgi:hypothetical protein